MFLCEAVVFTCSILMVVWDMASNEGMEGYDDMPAYTALCSISTFCALATTILMLLVPPHVRSCTTCAIPLIMPSAAKPRDVVEVRLLYLCCCQVCKSEVCKSRFGAHGKSREFEQCWQLLPQSSQLLARCSHQVFVQIKWRPNA
jgi:hypothetical protein